MSEPMPYNVEGCSTCPFRVRQRGTDGWCLIAPNSLENECSAGPPPKWCALRAAPRLVQLPPRLMAETDTSTGGTP